MSPAARSAPKQILPSPDEEAAVRVPSPASVSEDAACATFKKKMSSPPVAIFLLIVLSAGIVFSRGTRLADAKSAAGGADRQRILQLDAWEYIDEELLTLSTGQDEVARTTSVETEAIEGQQSGPAAEKVGGRRRLRQDGGGAPRDREGADGGEADRLELDRKAQARAEWRAKAIARADHMYAEAMRERQARADHMIAWFQSDLAARGGGTAQGSEEGGLDRVQDGHEYMARKPDSFVQLDRDRLN